jgi:hypothetical protein
VDLAPRRPELCAPAARSSALPPSPEARGSPCIVAWGRGRPRGDEAGRVGHFRRLAELPPWLLGAPSATIASSGSGAVPADRERIERKGAEQGIKRSGSLTDGSHIS